MTLVALENNLFLVVLEVLIELLHGGLGYFNFLGGSCLELLEVLFVVLDVLKHEDV